MDGLEGPRGSYFRHDAVQRNYVTSKRNMMHRVRKDTVSEEVASNSRDR